MNQKHFIILFLLFLGLSTTAIAQPYSISGKVTDGKDPIPGVTVTATKKEGDKTGTIADESGLFQIKNLSSGSYTIKISYIGFSPLEKTVSIIDQDIDLGTLKMNVATETLKDVVVETKQIRVEVKGDTAQFNADAYKVNRDANAEDLLSKMPGVTSTGGTLKVNGEDVKEVLVDGKPFFGNDPNAAIKNLPAEVISKIQVFDKQSDQSRFTGFDDGNSQKAINIITKSGKNNGQFGKVYAGYGTKDLYAAGGNINLFNGDRRISIIGLSNNINQQNFSTEDILGVINSSGNQRGGGAPGGGGGRRGGPPRPGGGTDVNDFLVGNQNGIAQTNSIGINYSDVWGKKIKVSGSYFYNSTDNNKQTELNRQYILSDTSLLYNENSTTNSLNQNHRLNLRLEYEMDSNNSFIISPRVSVQDNNTNTSLYGQSMYNSDVINSTATNNTTAKNNGYNISNDILYRHKFNKTGRTLSLMANTQLNNKVGDGSTYSLNTYNLNDSTLIDQQYTQTSSGYTLSGNVMYTEPIAKNMQLMATYRPSYTVNNANKETNDIHMPEGTYTDFDTLLSNKYNSTYMAHEGGFGLRFQKDRKIMGMIGLNGQYATLSGMQEFPTSFKLEKNFSNILPMAFINFRPSNTKNIRLMYRTSTDAPSISQLQDVVNNSNPLLLSTGNPDLKQAVQHRLMLRYNSTNTEKATSFFAFVMGNYANDYIANATFIPTQDTVFSNGTIVNQGSQISLPVNLDGYFNGKTFLTYGLPLSFIKSNLNLNTGFTYTRTPAMINNQLNLSNNYEFSGGLVLGSNISEKVDFTLSYTGNYNIAQNTLQSQSDYSYYYQVTSLKLNLLTLKDRLVWNTNINHNLYTGLTDGYDQSFFLWNAYVGYKFLKDRSLEAKLSVYDILNQNTAVGRTVTDTYIEDSYNNVLNRYFMLTLTYSLRNFKI